MATAFERWEQTLAELAKNKAKPEDVEKARIALRQKVIEKARQEGHDNSGMALALSRFDNGTRAQSYRSGLVKEPDVLTEDERSGVDHPVLGGIKQAAKELVATQAQGWQRIAGSALRLANDFGENEKGTWLDRAATSMEDAQKSTDEFAGEGYATADGVRGFGKMGLQNAPILISTYLTGGAAAGATSLAGRAAGLAKTAQGAAKVANAARWAGAGGAAAAGFSGEYGDARQQTLDKFKSITPEQMRESEKYAARFKAREKELYLAGAAPEDAAKQAYEETVDALSETDANIVGVVNSLIEFAAPGASKFFLGGGKLSSKSLANAKKFVNLDDVKDVSKQFGQEFLQEGFTSAVTDDTRAKAMNEDVNWGQVGKDALVGGTLGAIMGGGAQFSTGQSTRQRALAEVKAQEQQQGLDAQLGQAAQARKAELDAIRQQRPLTPEEQEDADVADAILARNAPEGQPEGEQQPPVQDGQPVPQPTPAPAAGAPVVGANTPPAGIPIVSNVQPPPEQPAPGLSGVVQRHTQSAAPSLDAAFSDAIKTGQSPDFSGLAQQTGIDRNSLVDQFNAKRTDHVRKQGLMDLAEQGDLNALRSAVSGITVDPQQQDQLIEEAVSGNEQRKAEALAASQQQGLQAQQQAQQAAQQQAEKDKYDQTYSKMLDEAVAALEGGQTEVKTFLPIKKKYSASGLNATDVNGVIDHAKQVIAEKQQKAARHEQAVTEAMPHLQSGDEASAVLAMEQAGVTDDADVQSVLKEANKRIRQDSKKPAGTQSVPAGQQAAPVDQLSTAVAEVKAAQTAGKKVNLATIAKKHGVTIMDVAKGVAAKPEQTAPKAKPSQPLALPAPQGPATTGDVMVSRNGKVMSQAEADALSAASDSEKKQMRRDMAEEAGNPTGIPTGMKPKVEKPARTEQKAVLPNLILRTDGKPFPDTKQATRVLASKKLEDTHEVVSVEGGKAIAPKKSVTAKNQVDPEKDDILSAIAKLGGIDRAQAKSQGIDPADFSRRAGGIQFVFRKNGGKELDRMAEALSEMGYPVTENGDYTVNALLDSLDAALRGSAVGTPQFHEAKAQAMYEEEAAQREIDAMFDSTGNSAEPDWLSFGADDFVSSILDGDITPNAVIASELAGIENERTVTGTPEAAGQKVDANPAPSSGAKGIAAAAGGGTERQQKGKSDSQPDSEVQDFGLKAQTEAERLAEEQRQAADLEARRQADESVRLKAQADKDREGFMLTGSNRPADVAMAAGQNDLFAPKTRGHKEAEKNQYADKIMEWDQKAAKWGKAKIVESARSGVASNILGRDFAESADSFYAKNPSSRATRDWLYEADGRGVSDELAKIRADQKPAQGDNTHKTEDTISDADYAQVVEAAKYLKDIVYSLDNLLGDDKRLLLSLSSPLGKSGRDTILMDTFGIDRNLAHTIHNRMDDSKPHKLRDIDMTDALDTFPMLKKIIDDVKEELRLRDERKAAKDIFAPQTRGEKEAKSKSVAVSTPGIIKTIVRARNGGRVIAVVSDKHNGTTEDMIRVAKAQRRQALMDHQDAGEGASMTFAEENGSPKWRVSTGSNTITELGKDEASIISAEISNRDTGDKIESTVNSVMTEVRSMGGDIIGVITDPYSGNKDDIMGIAQSQRSRMFDRYPDASNMQSTTIATDGSGRPAWRVSPNMSGIEQIGQQTKNVAPEVAAVESKPEPVKWFGSRDKADAWIAKNGPDYHVVQAGPSRFEVFAGKKPATPNQINKQGNPARKRLGVNYRGETLYEDEMGVRSYATGGVLVSESVPIIPGKGIERGELTKEYKTADELSAENGQESGKAAPTEDLDAMFDDVLEEVTGKPKATNTPKASVESAFTGEPDSKNSAPMQELGGFAVGDKVAISGRSVSEGVIRQLFTRQSSGGEMNMARVEIAGGKTLDLLTDNLSRQERTAGQAAASAAKNTGMALGDAIDGLGKLFGGKGTLNSGLTFDKETYAKAKPYFIAAISHLRAAGRDLRETMRAVIKMVVDKFGVEAAENMKPYVVQFISDVRDGKIDDPAATLNSSDTNEATGNDVRKLDTTGAGTLEGVSSGEVQRPETEQPAGAGADGGSRGNSEGNGRVPGAGVQRDGGVGTDAQSAPVSGTGERGRVGGRGRRGGRGTGGTVSEGVSANNERGAVSGGRRVADSSDASQPQVALEPGRIDPPQLPDDFIIEDDLALGEGGQRTKYKQNVEAIKLVKALDAEGRTATTEEQKIIAKYVGWGGIPQAFDPSNSDWSAQYSELNSILTKEEYESARESTQYAHYTSREIIGAMYSALRQFGFTGGNVLEAGGGVGNFIGLMPVEMRTNGKVTLIERERIASAIARHLYPRQNVRTADFTEFGKGQDGQYDAQIGNPPFASTPLTDKSDRRHLSGLSVHNYFIAKGIDMLRPGGITAVVVSNSFMDATGDRARKYIGERAKLLGAIRLPNNAFSKNANTQVTTDIIFLQKLPEAEWGSKSARDSAKQWIDTVNVSDPKGGKDIPLNRYFVSNPQMMLGQWGRFGTMRGPDQPALVARQGQNTDDLLQRAVASLPKDVFKSLSEERKKAMESALLEKLHDDTVSEGGFYADGGKLWRRVNDVAGEEMAEAITASTIISGTKPIGENGVSRLMQLAALRKTMRGLLAAEIADNVKSMDALRADLNRQYDAYVRDNGKLNDTTTKRLMRDDPDYPLLAALEMDYEPGMGPAAAKREGIKSYSSKAKKAAIFDRRVIEARKPVTAADSPQDAINISMAERGRLDADYVGRLLGIPSEEVLDQLSSGASPLLFRDPASGEYVLRDAYLSGNVREKLKQAQAAGMSSNVRALEEVLPEDVPASQISVRLGSPWVPMDVYRDFAKHLFGEGTKTLVSYISANGSFNGVIKPESDVAAMTKFGTKSYPGDALMLALMNNRQIKVTYRDDDGKTHTDQKATEEANAKADEIKQAFQDWAFKDADRAELMARSYNDSNNNYVVRKYDGSWLSFPGKVPDAIITFRRHQRNAIARTVQDRTSLYDHVVGAGKTFTAIASAMELKRTGLANKPMMVVPNHLVGQWAADFYRLYPGAKVLAATKKDFERTNRRKFMAKIASGDWDAIIIAHSSFSYIKPNPEFELQFNQGQIDGIVRDIEAVKAEDGEEQQKKRTVKQLEKLKESLENKIARLRDKPMDDLLDFQQLGVDQLFVDEAHLFKNLMFGTKMQNVRGLGDPAGSQRAYDMYLKTRQLMDQNGRGQGVVFMTGTPVSNSLAEMYHMMRYLMPQQMEQLGFDSFDAWANTFASVNQVWMQNASGDGFKAQNRMSSFDNIPELLKMFDQVADTVTMDDIKAAFREENNGKEFPLPPLATGRRIPVPLEKSDAQIEYMEEIAKRAKALEQRKGPPQKGDDNVLVLMTDARKAAMDIRLVNPDVMGREAGGRIDRASDEIVSRWKKYADQRGVQLVFSDLGTPKSAVKAELKEYEALMARVNAAANQDVIDDANLGVESALDILADAEDAQNTIEAKGADWLGSIQAAQRGFSVYDDLKSALVEKGIPENQIAFIHDYNTDDQKAALFRKVNNGDIRVMVGSTPKMGAGTNVQKRLVALHHLDVPWKPSDLEQREGRIIRQGNLLSDEEVDRKPNPLRIPGFEVEILAYVTKDTLDMRMWQIQETKLKMINQLRSRQIDRDMENAFEEMEMSAGEMQAAATGNMDLLREIQLRTEVQKLEKKQRAFDAGRADVISGLRRAKAQMESIPGQILRAKVLAEGAEKVRNLYLEHVNSFKATINGKDYTDRTVASQALRDMTEAVETGDDGKERKAKLDVTLNGEHYTNRQKLAEAFARLTGDREPFVFEADGEVMHRLEDASDAILDDIEAAKESNAPRVIGSMGPFTVSIEYEGVSAGDRDAFNVYAEIGDADVSAVVRGGEDDRATGRNIARAVRDMVRDAPNGLESEMKRLEKAKKTVADYEKIDTSEAWPDGDKLERLRAEHRSILERMSHSESPELNIGQRFSVTSVNHEGAKKYVVTTPGMGVFKGDTGEYFNTSEDAVNSTISKATKEAGSGPFLVVKTDHGDGFTPDYKVVRKGYDLKEYEYIVDAKDIAAHDQRFSVGEGSGPALTTTTAREILAADPVLSKAAPFIEVKNSRDGVPAGAEVIGAEGYYHNGKVTLFADNIKATPTQTAEERLKWVAFHEVTHRGVANLAESREYMAELQQAGKNPFIKNLAKKIHAKRQGTPYEVSMEVAIEEALAEANAALQTGSSKTIKAQYGLHFPLAIRGRAKSAIARFFEAVKRIYNKLTGRGLTNEQVGDLLRKTHEAGMGPGDGPKGGKKFSADSGTINIDGKDRPTTNSTGKPIATTEAGIRNFWKWFGDSKIVDEQGRPLVVYHGSRSTDALTEFVVSKSEASNTRLKHTKDGAYFTRNPDKAADYAGQDGSTYPVYLKISKPKMISDAFSSVKVDAAQLKTEGFDGMWNPKGFPSDEIVAIDKNQIKSATGNNGDFSADTSDIRYSAPPTDDTSLTRSDFVNIAKEWMFQKWANTLGTQLNTAMLEPLFKPTYQLVQRYLQHTSNDAYDAISVAPNLLGRLEDGADYWRETKNSFNPYRFRKINADREAAAVPLFEGTRFDKKVYSDAVLKRVYNLTDDQVAVYREARAAIEASLDSHAKSVITKILLDAGAVEFSDIDTLVNRDLPADDYMEELRQRLDADILAANDAIAIQKTALSAAGVTAQDKASIQASIKKGSRRVELLEEAAKRIDSTEDTLIQLKREGYFPLMRWGKYTVTVKDAGGNVMDFRMVETLREKAALSEALTKQYQGQGMTVTSGTMDEGRFKDFRGMSPETLALFAKELGVDNDEAYQEYLKLALPGQSALKRRIHRKGDNGEGIAGFSMDIQRTLASFVMGNARHSARNIYGSAITKSVDAIPGERGDVRGLARNLAEFVTQPDENGTSVSIRNMLFVWNMGASVAFGALNLSQPWMMTLPWLSQFSGVGNVAGIMGKASKTAAIAQKNGTVPQEYYAEYQQAVREGHVDPQNVFMLQGIERGGSGLGSSLLKTISHGMGMIAAATESYNRKLTLFAALDVARAKGLSWLKSKGFDSAYAFAVQAVAETQGVYNKGNRPTWARGPIGAVLLVFKQYAVNWIEMAVRMGRNHYGDDRMRKGLMMMLGLLFAMAGAMGMPGAEDLKDIAETAMGSVGKPVNIERQMQMTLGKGMADAVMAGPMNALVLNSIGLDMHGRMSMGNIIPGTGAFNPYTSTDAKLSEGISVMGAGTGLLKKGSDAVAAAQDGRFLDAAQSAAPRAVESIMKGVRMMAEGKARDARGNVLMETTPAQAVSKMLDFQPASVAITQRERGRRFQDKNIQVVARASLRNRLITAYEEKDAEKIRDAEQALDEWNQDNPLYQVKLKKRDLRRAAKKRGSSWLKREETPKGLEWMDEYAEAEE